MRRRDDRCCTARVIRIHRELGPGLLESVYENVLAASLARRGLQVESAACRSIRYDGIGISTAAFRVDLLVERSTVIVEIKSVEQLTGAARQADPHLLATAGAARRAATELFGRDDEGRDSTDWSTITGRAAKSYASRFAPSRDLIIWSPWNTAMFDLHGMTALVTGASGGIGSAIATGAGGAGRAAGDFGLQRRQAARVSRGAGRAHAAAPAGSRSCRDHLRPVRIPKTSKS